MVELRLLEMVTVSGGVRAVRLLRWLVEGGPMTHDRLGVDVAWSSGDVAL